MDDRELRSGMREGAEDLARRVAGLACPPSRSPAFVYSSDAIIAACRSLQAGLGDSPGHVLYATKACGLEPVLSIVRPFVAGFAVASPAEARLVVDCVRHPGQVHITTPGFKREWFDELSAATHVAFNSLPQLARLQSAVCPSTSVGIRVNPGRSNVDDEKYDPCRPHSKLGVPIRDLMAGLARGDLRAGRRLQGIHVHNACLSPSWTPLLETVMELTRVVGPFLSSMEWINLGGGYVWDDTTDFAPLRKAVDLLASRYGVEVFIEPGAGIVNSAGFLVATVIDVFESDGMTVAVLDTTVNHLPEVFEYQYEPDIVEHVDGGRYEYILAGCSCLAGDLFGEYSFATPLTVGSRVTFANVGAYALVKAHTFNGISLPTIYLLRDDVQIELVRDSTSTTQLPPAVSLTE